MYAHSEMNDARKESNMPARIHSFILLEIHAQQPRAHIIVCKSGISKNGRRCFSFTSVVQNFVWRHSTLTTSVVCIVSFTITAIAMSYSNIFAIHGPR
jgi:hypothetical protein